ncbi:hypothetical protein M5065_10195 [Neisseria meningitidis]|nr:hypothetical protein [Neisseria meningitidis]MCL6072407.1 hypothetical protein [Neisseria meningitidis]
MFTKAHRSEEGEEGIVGGGAAFGGNKKTLSDSDMTNFPKKIPLKALTVFPCGRIVRFFAADEAAVMKQFKRSLTKQITDKCECLEPHTV